MSKQIFRLDDKVYHWKYGWGKVVSPHDEECYTRFESKDVVTSKLIPVRELSFTEYDFENGGLSHERPFELEVGKSYVYKESSFMIINRVGNYGNCGFSYGRWDDKMPCYTPEKWREATYAEVKQALEKETIRRFGYGWGSAKIKKNIDSEAARGFSEGKFASGIRNSSCGWYVASENGLLFYRGVWAEKLEEPKYSEFETGESVFD